MTEKEFHGLLVEMIKRGNNPNKRKILEILERATLSCDKTNIFTQRKWNHFQEYIYITVAPSDLMELMNYKNTLSRLLNKSTRLMMIMNMSCSE